MFFNILLTISFIISIIILICFILLYLFYILIKTNNIQDNELKKEFIELQKMINELDKRERQITLIMIILSFIPILNTFIVLGYFCMYVLMKISNMKI